MVRAEQDTHVAQFPDHLRDTGSKFYRTVTLAQLADASDIDVGFRHADELVHWLLTRGPVRIRFRWHKGMTPQHPSGRVDVVGEKQGRQTCALVGYDSGEAYPFRLLTPFGSGFGQLGRVWLSFDGIVRLIDEGAEIDAPRV